MKSLPDRQGLLAIGGHYPDGVIAWRVAASATYGVWACVAGSRRRFATERKSHRTASVPQRSALLSAGRPRFGGASCSGRGLPAASELFSFPRSRWLWFPSASIATRGAMTWQRSSTRPRGRSPTLTIRRLCLRSALPMRTDRGSTDRRDCVLMLQVAKLLSSVHTDITLWPSPLGCARTVDQTGQRKPQQKTHRVRIWSATSQGNRIDGRRLQRVRAQIGRAKSRHSPP